MQKVAISVIFILHEDELVLQYQSLAVFMDLPIPKHIEYITKENGAAYVQIPVAEWEEFLSLMTNLLEHKRQLEREALKAYITEGSAEVRAMQTGKSKEKSMRDFLDTL